MRPRHNGQGKSVKSSDPFKDPISQNSGTDPFPPTHEPWEVLVNHLGYGETDFDQELADFRAVIDSVQPPASSPLITEAQRVGTDFQFSFHADADQTYLVQSGTNLMDWTTVGTVEGSNSPVQFTHTNSPPSGQLYRVVIP